MYKDLINEVFTSVFRNKYILIKALLIPFILLLLITYFNEQYKDSGFLKIFLGILSYLVTVSIAITTHRILLLGENAVPTWGVLNLTSREIKFILNTLWIGVLIGLSVLLFGVFSALFASIFSFTSELLVIVFIVFIALLGIYFFTRVSLIFPSIAVDDKLDIVDSIEYTKNHKLLVFFVVGIFPIIITLLVGTVYGLVIGFLVGVVSSNLSVLYSVLDLFITVFVISSLSSTYKFLKKEKLENKQE